MRAEQHIVLRLTGFDLFDHFAHMRGDCFIIEREEVAQGRDSIAASVRSVAPSLN